MGYRTYLGYIPKNEYNKIKNLSYDELIKYYKREDDGYISNHYIVEELLEFGKYDEVERDNKHSSPFFPNKETQNHFDGEFYIIDKEFFKQAINSYRDIVKQYYIDMIDPFVEKDDRNYIKIKSEFLNSIQLHPDGDKIKKTFDISKITEKEQTAIFEMFEHIKSFYYEWNVGRPYNLDDENDSCTTSWKYEYEIFEMVRIYKSFDWDKNILVFYGW